MKSLRVNCSDEMIQIGPLGVRFLVTGADSNGSAAIFEMTVPAGERLTAPAHSHDRYEETIYGLTAVLTWRSMVRRLTSRPDSRCAFPAARSIGLTITPPRTSNSSASSVPACSDPSTFVRWRR